jgi:Cdc6-like AAA superfamily ATPase
MIKEYLIKKAFDELIRYLKTLDKLTQRKLLVDKKGFENAISKHINFVKNWASEISFKDLTNAKNTQDTYVDLNLYLTPKKNQLLADRTFIPLDDILKKFNRNIIILGNPGAGKTTSMKFICNKLIYDETFLTDLNFPIVIRLRDLKVFKNFQGNTSEDFVESLFFHLYEILGLQVEIKSPTQTYLINSANYRENYTLLKNVILSVLDDLNILLILDGLDEVFPSHKKQLIEELRILSLNLNSAKFVLTCRTGEFNYSIENAKVFEICELNDAQIKVFIEKWLVKKDLVDNVYNAILESPYKDTLSKPLTLAHLCAIYERYGRIPEKPKTLYKKIVTLLIEDWDNQRSIHRKSKYSDFDTDRKFDFLCNLSFYFTTKLQSLIFSKYEFKSAYKEICINFNLPLNESEEVAVELESHTGLFLQTSYEEFEFAHKSLQEYLSAEYLVRLPQIPFETYLLNVLPNELALAIAISSNPTLYISNLFLVNFQINKSINNEFLKPFLSRLYIEKPDFIVDPILGVTFMSIAEKLNQSEPSIIFGELTSAIQVKKSIKAMMNYYKIDSEVNRQNNKIITLLNISSFANNVTSHLPAKIVVNKKYLNY